MEIPADFVFKTVDAKLYNQMREKVLKDCEWRMTPLQPGLPYFLNITCQGWEFTGASLPPMIPNGKKKVTLIKLAWRQSYYGADLTIKFNKILGNWTIRSISTLFKLQFLWNGWGIMKRILNKQRKAIFTKVSRLDFSNTVLKIE